MGCGAGGSVSYWVVFGCRCRCGLWWGAGGRVPGEKVVVGGGGGWVGFGPTGGEGRALLSPPTSTPPTSHPVTSEGLQAPVWERGRKRKKLWISTRALRYESGVTFLARYLCSHVSAASETPHICLDKQHHERIQLRKGNGNLSLDGCHPHTQT